MNVDVRKIKTALAERGLLVAARGEIPNHVTPLVVCQSGVRSHRAAQFLKQADFPLVYSLAGGTGGWHAAGYPVDAAETPSVVALSDVVGPH